jgi:CubicO group peptidase (beta-lactamase class C family)
MTGRTGITVTADPGAVGLDAGRLARIDAHFQRYVDDGRLPGFLVTVARGGHVAHVGSGGHRHVAHELPVTTDTIWRLYSMTKPITAVAALTLWEQGLFEMKDPVARFIPSFAKQRVWRSGSVTNPMYDPVSEPMQMWHLFSHTAGLTYGFLYAHPVDELYRRAGFEWNSPAGDLAETCDRLAELPLLFQPGTEWNYSMSIDVLGRVIEVISGQRLDEYIHDHVLAPLGMHDTTWHVDDDHADRLAHLYGAHPQHRTAVPLDTAAAQARQAPDKHLGGGGLLGTAGDYHRFTQMLVNAGQLDGVRILSPRTVRFMASNHLPGNADLTRFGRPLFSETAFDGVGFGLGVSVTLDPVAAKVPGSPGDFAWGGAASTAFWVDPTEALTVMFFTQLLPSSTHPIRSQLKQLVYQAIL